MFIVEVDVAIDEIRIDECEEEVPSGSDTKWSHQGNDVFLRCFKTKQEAVDGAVGYLGNRIQRLERVRASLLEDPESIIECSPS